MHNVIKGKVSSSFMEHFISQRTPPFLAAFSTSGNTLKLLNYFNASNTSPNYGSSAMCRRVLPDVRGIVRVCEVFVKLLG